MDLWEPSEVRYRLVLIKTQVIGSLLLTCAPPAGEHLTTSHPSSSPANPRLERAQGTSRKELKRLKGKYLSIFEYKIVFSDFSPQQENIVYLRSQRLARLASDWSALNGPLGIVGGI